MRTSKPEILMKKSSVAIYILRMRLFQNALITSLLSFVFLMPAGTCVADVQFDQLYGSDLGMGIGARAIGMGGAYVSIAQDPSAIFWNPAGLININHVELFLSAETPKDFSAASLIYKPKINFLNKFDLTVGLSYVRRLKFKGDSKEDDWSGYPSHLLDMAMIDIDDNFSGSVDSQTCDTRISIAFAPPWIKNLSMGLNYIFLK